MESPFRARSDMGARGSISAILSRFIRKRVCAFAILPFILLNIFLLVLSWLSQNLKIFYCWTLHVLRKPTSSCAVSGHFSCLADSPAFWRGQSAVQNSKSTREPAICVFQLKSPADGSVFTSGRSAIVSKNCTRTLPETCCPASLAGGQSTYMSRTVHSRLAQIYTELTRKLRVSSLLTMDGPHIWTGQSALSL